MTKVDISKITDDFSAALVPIKKVLDELKDSKTVEGYQRIAELLKGVAEAGDKVVAELAKLAERAVCSAKDGVLA